MVNKFVEDFKREFAERVQQALASSLPEPTRKLRVTQKIVDEFALELAKQLETKEPVSSKSIPQIARELADGFVYSLNLELLGNEESITESSVPLPVPSIPVLVDGLMKQVTDRLDFEVWWKQQHDPEK